jgi:hypothetical protein
MLSKLRSFATMPLREKVLLALAWMVLAAASALLRMVSFRRLSPLLGEKMAAPVGCLPAIGHEGEEAARLVRLSILRAVRLAPFRSDCLPQAFAAAFLCRAMGVPAAVYLGVRLHDIEGLQAHAWVDAGKLNVTGGHSLCEFKVISCFLSSGHKPFAVR